MASRRFDARSRTDGGKLGADVLRQRDDDMAAAIDRDYSARLVAVSTTRVEPVGTPSAR
ncbi:hypothetical protein [Nevskia sp.]|uniref:hypothetical protein n=1 Tax=Nevskia sp. TaxID=1929292 RepID=UPI0025FAC29C|nr:hypothetical protein [Nevskia sp.]